MSYALQIDPATGDIVLDDDGQVVIAEDPSPELLLAIGIPLGEVLSDPEQGSRVPMLVSGGEPARSRAEIEAAASDGLQRLVDAGLVLVEGVEYDSAEREITIRTAELADPFRVEV